jgi:hypothetical protein
MKTLYFILIISLNTALMAQSSSCTVTYTVSGITIDTECQACYKKNSCFILNYKNDFSKCSQKIQVEDNINCFSKYLFYGVFSKEAMVNVASKIIAAKTFKHSKCLESKSGEHLWKTTNESESLQLMHDEINNLKDYCELWGEIDSETRTEVEFLMMVCVEEFSKK